MRAVPGLLLVSLLTAAACSAKFTSQSDGAGGTSGVSGEGGASSGAAGNPIDEGGRPAEAGRPGVGTAGEGAGEGGTRVDPGGGTGMGGIAPISGGAGGAAPVKIPERDLVLWLRADEGVSHTGGVVTRWTDSSAFHVEATQTATNYRPLLVPNALGGKAAVVFDGVDDYLKLPPLDVDFSAGASIVYAGAQAAAKECEAVFEASNGDEVDDLHLGRWKGSALYEVSANFLHAANYPFVPGEPEVLMGIQQASGLASLRRNTFGLGEGDFATPAVTSRANVFVGRTLYQNCTPFSGAIGELLVYNRALDDTEIVELEGYLQQKWNCCAE